jgi:hypothetical protein
MRLIEHHAVCVALKQLMLQIDKLGERIDFLSDRIDAWETQYSEPSSSEESDESDDSVQSAPASFSY